MCLSFENICLYSSLMVRCSTISIPFLLEFWLNFVFEKLYSVLLSWWTQENIMMVCQQHGHALFCTMGICDSMCFWNCIILLENFPNLMALQEWEGVVIIACLNNLSDCTLQCFCCWGSMILSSRNCSKAAAHPAVWTGQMDMAISLIVFEICPDFEHVVLPWGSVGLFMGSYKLGQRVAVCWVIAVSFSVFPERNSLPPWASVRGCAPAPFTSLGICLVLWAPMISKNVSFVPSLCCFGCCSQTFPFLSAILEWLTSALSKTECCNDMQWGSSEWSEGIPLPSPAALQPSCSAKAAGKNIAVIRDKVGLWKLMFLPY